MKNKTYTFKSEHYGDTTFLNYEFTGPAEGSLAHTNVKVVVRGTASLNRVNTAKFGPQIQLQVYGTGRRIEARAPNTWNRAEIFLSIPQARELLEALIITLHREGLPKKTPEV